MSDEAQPERRRVSNQEILEAVGQLRTDFSAHVTRMEPIAQAWETGARTFERVDRWSKWGAEASKRIVAISALFVAGYYVYTHKWDELVKRWLG